MFYCIGGVHETSPGTHTLFPSYTCSINTKCNSVQLSDFDLLRNLMLTFSLKCSRPEFCLILSSDSTSRWTPLLRLYSSHCRADWGLSPVRTCAHREHTQAGVTHKDHTCLCILSFKKEGTLPSRGSTISRHKRSIMCLCCMHSAGTS